MALRRKAAEGGRQLSDALLKVIPLKRRRPLTPAFQIKWDTEIASTFRGEFMIKGILPNQGFGVLYGQSQSLKSFLALDMALHVALGRRWAGRRVTQGVVFYVAAEGMSGMAKRVEGFRQGHGPWPGNVPFALMPAAPNLGSTNGDIRLLVESIESTGKLPRLIVLDTLSQMLGGADENGGGMTAFVRNAQTLSNHFACFVLAIHHVGLGDDKSRRLRGHSSLHAAVDVQILAERLPDGYASTLTVQKFKDAPTDVCLTANLRRIALGVDDDGDEISTLVVDRIDDGLAPRTDRKRAAVRPPKLSAGANTALSALKSAQKLHGAEPEPCEQIPAGVKTVPIAVWREQSYKSGISTGEDESANRKAFTRAFDSLKDAGKIGTWDGLAWAA